MKLVFKGLNYLFKKIDSFKAYVNKGYIRSKYDVHKTVGIKSTTKIYGNGEIHIKEGTYFGSNTSIVANPKNAVINIGKNCMISHEVHLRTSQYDVKTLHLPKQDRKSIYADITIGDNVWIGKGVYIKGGITIGNNVTIGANSVVVKNIESDMIVGGIPAKIIRTR